MQQTGDSIAAEDHAKNVSARLRSLVTSAAHSTGAGSALLVLQQNGQLAPAVQYGTAVELFRGLERFGEQLLGTEVAVEKTVAPEILTKLRAHSPDLSFFASLPISKSGVPVGFLALCDVEARIISGAQEYVLRTLAAEIGDQLQLESLRQTHEQTLLRHSTATERLRLLESVVVNANDAVLITEAEPIDLPGPRILYVNAAFTRATGYTLEEVIGKTPRILQGPDTNREPLKRLKKALRRWKPVEVELMNYRKDGTTFWVELSIVPVCNEAGWYTHWVSVQRDISERKQNEDNAVQLRVAQDRNEALAREVEARMRSEAELAHTAFHDNLTGLRNRAYFLDKLKSSVEVSAIRPNYQCAVLFIDLDDFKGVNDRFGHSVGDLLLQEVAGRLSGCTRPQDTVARMGGDEFTLLLESVTGMHEVIAVADRVLEALSAPVRLAGNEMVPRASIGLSFGAGTDAEHLLRAADTAMYRAKEDGGSGYALFNDEMHRSVMTALRIRTELREAVHLGQFEVHYQPLVNTGAYQVCGLEALVRWRHPERGLIPPLEFIGIAEETGLIVPLGSWVLRQACKHLQSWKASYTLPAGFMVSVNVSTRQLEEAGFFDDLRSILDETGIPPQQLQLEITESVFLRNPEYMGALFRRIRATGVHIACDDFGTGYSSLSYLRLYPIDTIKIDQSFVRRLYTDQADTDIIRMIIGLAGALGMAVSAEGVEETRQQTMLSELGCTVVQGYLYSRPVPFAETTRLLEAGLPVTAKQSALPDAAQVHTLTPA